MTKKALLCATIFALAFVISWVIFSISINKSSDTQALVDDFLNANLNVFQIFGNNLLFCIFTVAGAGIISVPLIAWQGFQMGILLAIWMELGNSVFTYMSLVLPHAILELTALFICGGLGLELLRCFKLYMFKRDMHINSWIIERKKYVFVIPTMLAIAAIIECFFTPKFFKGMM